MPSVQREPVGPAVTSAVKVPWPVAAEPAGTDIAAGDVLELTAGEAVHGGWCVARPAAAGPVVFVRHALPGERVRVVVTQTTARFARADAVEVLSRSRERVTPPCPYAGPGRCGGCDWQHASLPEQRRIKGQVVSDQLRRIAGLDLAVTVEPLPGDDDGLGWRTRVRFAVGRDGGSGLYRHRSHEIVPVTQCAIAHPLVNQAGITSRRWPGARSVDVAVAPETGQTAVLVTSGRSGPARSGRDGKLALPPQPRFLTRHAAGRDWRVAAGGFWQTHPAAADVLAQAVLAALRPQPGETALDLYCGAGLFAGVLAEAVGPDGTVIAVEEDGEAVRDARFNLRPMRWARVHRGDAAEVLARFGPGAASIAVLDPPRTGLSQELISLLPPGPAGPDTGGLREIAYVSCDPATLARDLSWFAGHGWRLGALRAFDAFPMTHHVELLASLVPAG